MKNKEFRWNETKREVSFWNPDTDKEEVDTRTTKDIIKYGASIGSQEYLQAICRALLELMEIEENRNDQN